MYRSLAIVLLSMAAAEAIVVFPDSAVIDELDFANNAPTQVSGICRDLCHIYATAAGPPDRAVAANLLIQTAKGFVSVLSVADQINATTRRLTPLEVKNMPNLVITNVNHNYQSGKIVVYVVNQNADYFKTAEVYEANQLDRRPSYASVITILSPESFTLKESNYMSMGIIAKLAGFDTLDGDICPAVYSLSWLPFPGFQMMVSSPIISLKYDLKQFPYPAGELRATIGFSDTHRLEQNGFLASPGWHGCAGRLAYRSSQYAKDGKVEMKLVDDYTSDQDVYLNVQTNAIEAAPVIVRDPDYKELGRYFDVDNAQEVQQFRLYKLYFDFTYNEDTHYLVRYNSTAKPIY